MPQRNVSQGEIRKTSITMRKKPSGFPEGFILCSIMINTLQRLP